MLHVVPAAPAVTGRAMAAARAFGVLLAVIAVLVLLCIEAHADELPDAGAVELVFPPDGGSALPAPIYEGQRAPADGVFLTLQRAAALAAERAELKIENDALKKDVVQADKIPGWVWLATCAVSVVVGGVVAAKVGK